MKIDKLDLPDAAIEFLKSQGYEKLYPPQADSIKLTNTIPIIIFTLFIILYLIC